MSNIFTTPAINLLGVVLVSLKTKYYDGSLEYEKEFQFIVQDFKVEEFFMEYEALASKYYYEMPIDDFILEFPTFYDLFQDNNISLTYLEVVEINYAIDFPVAGFPRYIQGYELENLSIY